MPQAKGYKAQLIAGFENVFGQTPATPNGVKLPINTSQLKSKQNMIETNTITSRRDPVKPGKGNIDVSGSVVIPVDEVGIGYWLKAMFGSPETTGTGTYTHVFKPSDNQPSLVLEQGFTDINVYEQFNGCKISKFTINLGGDGELTSTIDIMGAKEGSAAVSFDPSATEIDLIRFDNFQASIEEGGATVACVVNTGLTVEFGLAGDVYALGGQGVRSEIPEGMLKISGNIKAFFENASLLQKAIQGRESSLVMKLANGAHSLEFRLPQIVYERNAPGIEGAKGVLIDLPFRAYYTDNSYDTSIVATLINDQALY